MDYEDQVEYIEQLICRFRNDLYDRSKLSKSSRNWQLTSSYKSEDSETKCDFVHQNGNRCNRPIKNIFVAKNTTSNEIIKIGSTCLKKLLGVPNNSDFKAEKFYSDNEELVNRERVLKNALEESRKLIAAEAKELRNFSTYEKEKIIIEAEHFRILPASTELLLSAGIPLSEKEYEYLYRNTKRVSKEHREKERLAKQIEEQKAQREKQLREEALRKTQEKRARAIQEIKLKKIQEEKKHVNQQNFKSKPLPFLFGNKGITAIDIELNESLRKIFIDSGINKENLFLNNQKLLSLATKLSDYYCETKCSSDSSNDTITLALIVTSIKEYYGISTKEQLMIQMKIKDEIFEYFKNDLSRHYNLSLLSRGKLGFKYSIN